MTFLEKLDRLMAEKHINKPKLAELSGVPYTTIDGFYKKGYANAQISNIQKIARVFDTSVDYLFEEDEGREEISFEARMLAKSFDRLDDWGKKAVRGVVTAETQRVEALTSAPKIKTRIIPLLGARFAAGVGEPDFGNALEEYEVPADARADFAVRVHGDSMEPWFPDGSVQLGVKGAPKDGDVAALTVDGAFYIKQICLDSDGNLHLFSLNRDRKNLDLTIWASAGSNVTCFGTIPTQKKLPLPVD